MEDKKKNYKKKEDDVTLVRILGKDIRGDIKIKSALTKIDGIGWAISNAVCKVLELEMDKRIQDFSKDELARIEDFMKAPELPLFLKNRRNDFDSGKDMHVSGIDLKLRKEFDLKRLKKIKSYKGVRHIIGLPVRG